MKPKLYMETSIPSYLTARPSRNLLVAAHQQITYEWWETRRAAFDVYISQLVLDEAARGDPVAARRRLDVLVGLPLLGLTEAANQLTTAILQGGVFCRDASRDAAHIAVAAVHGIQFLLTWNCTHMANAEIREAVRATCGIVGFACPVICTPEELMGERANVEGPDY